MNEGQERFELRVDAPKPKPLQFEDSPTRQRACFQGMDCLAGQQDLFDTDGEQEA